MFETWAMIISNFWDQQWNTIALENQNLASISFQEYINPEDTDLLEYIEIQPISSQVIVSISWWLSAMDEQLRFLDAHHSSPRKEKKEY